MSDDTKDTEKTLSSFSNQLLISNPVVRESSQGSDTTPNDDIESKSPPDKPKIISPHGSPQFILSVQEDYVNHENLPKRKGSSPKDQPLDISLYQPENKFLSDGNMNEDGFEELTDNELVQSGYLLDQSLTVAQIREICAKDADELFIACYEIQAQSRSVVRDLTPICEEMITQLEHEKDIIIVDINHSYYALMDNWLIKLKEEDLKTLVKKCDATIKHITKMYHRISDQRYLFNDRIINLIMESGEFVLKVYATAKSIGVPYMMNNLREGGSVANKLYQTFFGPSRMQRINHYVENVMTLVNQIILDTNDLIKNGDRIMLMSTTTNVKIDSTLPATRKSQSGDFLLKLLNQRHCLECHKKLVDVKEKLESLERIEIKFSKMLIY
jgi:molybdopterin converting factor small subunit